MISFIREPTVIKFIETDSRMVGPGAGGGGWGVRAEWDGAEHQFGKTESSRDGWR